jgi:hypothetical protein
LIALGESGEILLVLGASLEISKMCSFTKRNGPVSGYWGDSSPFPLGAISRRLKLDAFELGILCFRASYTARLVEALSGVFTLF